MGLSGNDNQKQIWRRHPARVIVLCFLLAEIAAMPLTATEFYAAPNGSPSGDGTLDLPWDLQTALNHPTNVLGGDLIWLRGGIYRKANRATLFFSDLNGDPGSPITVRQLPGERATIDGNITQSSGGWVNYQGFEIMNSHSNRLTTESGPFPIAFTVAHSGQTNNLCVSGFDLRAAHIKLINLIVHDSIGGGIGVNSAAVNPELYGVLSFYNGWQGCDRSHGHGLYAQSLDPSFCSVQESLFFANYALGIQATSTAGLVDNLFLTANALFFNGALARKHQGNLLFGPVSGQANNIFMNRNFIYDTKGSGSDVNVGYQGGANNPVLVNNYFQTKVTFSPSNQNLTLSMNTFLSGTSFLNEENYPDNVYSTNRPSSNLVEVRPNIYEAGRAHIIVYNWENATNLAVDVSTVLTPDSEFEVRNAQDYYGAPVLAGTYTGELINLPMTNLRVAKPVGSNAPPSTAPEFNVFIICPRVNSTVGDATNTAPTLSFIGNQSTSQNVATAIIPFTVGDAEIPADMLTLSVASSRPELVPNLNIFFGGNGSNRTLRIQPEPNISGTVIITIAVSDGFLSASNVFSLTVTPSASTGVKLISPNGSAVLSIETHPKILLSIRGLSETEYAVQASTNLFDWNQIGKIVTDCNGLGLLQDSLSTNFQRRFYRFGTN